MSNLSDLIDKDDRSLQEFGAFVGTLADFAGGVGAVIPVAEFIDQQISPAKDHLQEFRDLIESWVNQVGDTVKAGQALDALRAIDNAVAKSQGVLDTIKAFVDAGGVGTPDAVQQVDKSREAVADLSGASAWLTVFFDQVYYNDLYPDRYVYPIPSGGHLTNMSVGWGPIKPGPRPDGLVFTHIYVMPAWMYAESVFLLAAAVLDPPVSAHYPTALTADADFLQRMHDQIVSGFYDLWAFEWDLVDWAKGSGYNHGVSPILDGMNVVGTRIDYGALDTYSGFTQMTQCQIPNTVSGSAIDLANPAINQKFLIRLMKQRKLLYSALGLRAVADLIRHLRSITKPVPNPGDWSFKEICAIAGTKKLSDVKKLLQGTPPFDTPSLGTSSFRVLLN